jgi:hypothetical protein
MIYALEMAKPRVKELFTGSSIIPRVGMACALAKEKREQGWVGSGIHIQLAPEGVVLSKELLSHIGYVKTD